MKIKAITEVPNHIVLGFGVLPTGIPGAVQSLNSLDDVLTSVVSSDNNTVVPDSTNSNMVVIEMPSLA
jgi:hypothetical protein